MFTHISFTFKANAKQLQQLKKLLNEYRRTQAPADEDTAVALPNIYLEFTSYHVTQVMKSYSRLFSITDIKENVEIWSYSHAKNIQVILNQVPKVILFDAISYCCF